MRFSKLSIVAFASLLLAACAIVPGGDVYISEQDQKVNAQSPSISVEQIEFVKLTSENTKRKTVKLRKPYRNFKLEARVDKYSYRVGAGDVLKVSVWEHPELLNLGTSETVIPVVGFQVDSRGKIFYPHVGVYHVGGRTVFAIREGLREALSQFVKNPQLDVTVIKYVANKIYMTGQLAKPIPIVMQGQAITLLDAINSAGGVSSKADLNDIVVIRKGKRRHIDLYAMLHYGDMRQNILLQSGDQIHVGATKPKYAHIMGQVVTPSTISISPEGVSLADGLASSRGINELTADAKAIYIIRESKIKGKVAKVYMLDLSNMAAMVLAAKFDLKAEDVVYIAKSPIVKWNQLLSVIRPTMSLVDAVSTTRNSVNNILK